MKLGTPISLPPITDAVVIEHSYNTSSEEARIVVQLLNEAGIEVARQTVFLRPSRTVEQPGVEEVRQEVGGVSRVVGRKNITKSFSEGGICTRVVVNHAATDYASATKTEQYVSADACANYLAARKASDDIAAIEEAGADDWLFPDADPDA